MRRCPSTTRQGSNDGTFEDSQQPPGARSRSHSLQLASLQHSSTTGTVAEREVELIVRRGGINRVKCVRYRRGCRALPREPSTGPTCTSREIEVGSLADELRDCWPGTIIHD
jgi:hypothetical protein